MKKWTAVFLIALLITVSAYGADVKPRIRSALHERDTVTVRMNAPEGGVLLLGVYDRATHQMTNAVSRAVEPAQDTQYVIVTLDFPPSSTEYVKAFLFSADDYVPLCVPVLADYVIPSG